MSSWTMRHGDAIFAKRRGSLLAECYFTERYFGVKTLTLHFKGQQRYTIRQLVSQILSLHCLLQSDLTSYPRTKVNFTLVTWQVIHERKTQCSETFSYFARQLRTSCRVKKLAQTTHEKLYHQLFPDSRLWHGGQSRLHAIYAVHYYRNFVHLWSHIARGEVRRSTFKVTVQCLRDNSVTFAGLRSISACD